jgi:hypothetical protein
MGLSAVYKLVIEGVNYQFVRQIAYVASSTGRMGLLPSEPVMRAKNPCRLEQSPSLTLSLACLHLVAHPVGMYSI